jgi:hypothetical protein
VLSWSRLTHWKKNRRLTATFLALRGTVPKLSGRVYSHCWPH